MRGTTATGVERVDEASLRAGLTSQGPGTPLPESARQQVLDAASALQMSRSKVAARVRRGGSQSVDGAEVVAVGGPAILGWIYDESSRIRELLSMSRSVRPANLRASLPLNRERIRAGMRMVSLFDYWGVDPESRMLLANETDGTYLFGVAPIQMKIVNTSYVLLDGPEIDGQPSLMRVTTPSCLEAAWRYWETAITHTIPVESVSPPADGLTPRQRQIVALLAADLGDDAIATALGVSVRTVRTDIAALLRLLGVRSRFAAGVRLKVWDEVRGD